MKKKPNILFISSHDSGRLFGCYGSRTVNTPAIDKLAAEGVRCSNIFATSSVSSPSKGSMLTGRYPQSNGLMGQCDEPWNWEMNNGEQHLAQLLKPEGYLTLLFRLQNETSGENWRRLGFDEFRAKELSFRSDAVDPQKAFTAVKVAKELTTFFGERAKRPGVQKPFYVQVGFHESMRPYDYGNTKRDTEKGVEVPQRLQDSEEAKSQMASLQGAINQVDKAVEIIMAGLKRCGMDNDTLVIFTSPNGVEMARDKGTLYDSGVEMPLILRWPAGLPAGTTCDALLSGVDVLPTIIDLIEGDTPFNLEGRSFAKNLLGEDSSPVRSEVYGLFTDSRYVRTGELKLIVNLTQTAQCVPPASVSKPDKAPTPIFELYDLSKDSLETDNRADDPSYASFLKELKGKLAAWMQEVNDPLLKKVYPTDYSKRAMSMLLS